MFNGLLNDFGCVLFMQIDLVEDVNVIVLDAQQQDCIGMVKAKVLTDGDVIIVIDILADFFDLPIMKNKAAYLAPFAYNSVTNKPLPLALCMFPYSSDYILTS